MHKKRYTKALTIIASIFYCVMFLAQKAEAMSDSQLSQCKSWGSSNYSIVRACEDCMYDGDNKRRGAMWLNDSSGNSKSNTVDANGQENVTVYLHGATYSCGYGGSGSFTATNIHVLSAVNSTYRGGLSGNKYDVSYISGFNGRTLNRGNTSAKWTWYVGGTISGTLNVKKLIEEEPSCASGSCDVTVGIYRCPSGGSGSACWADPSYIHVTGIEEQEEKPPEEQIADSCQKLASDLGGYSPGSIEGGVTQALSGVIKNAGTKWEHLVYAKPSEYIKFYHCYYPDAAKTAKSQRQHSAKSYPDYMDSHCDYYPCSCGEDETGPCYCCRRYYDWTTHGVGAQNRWLPVDNMHFELKASPESYKFKWQVVNPNNSFPYNSYQSYGENQSRNTSAVGIASPELNSRDYRCGTSPLGTYTIVGTDPRDCTSGINGGYWDPGTTFEQHIYYSGTLRTGVKQVTHGLDHGEHYDYREEDYGVREYGERNSSPAQVVVPYNFETSITVSMNTNPVVYPGATINSEVSGSILSKSNQDVGDTYATITPGSTVQIAQFTLPAWRSASGLDGDNNYNGSPADFARYVVGGDDVQQYTLASGTALNPDGDSSYDFQRQLRNGGSVNSVVPDLDTGTKLCTVAGIWPSDSHGIPDQGVGSGGNGIGSGPGQNSFGNWRISGVTCRTIAKKPTFQVWSGGIYTRNSIQTSITDKCLRSGVMIERECNRTVYGSWSEYEAVSIGAITNFASAAGYGFSSTPDAHGNYGRDGGTPKSSYDNYYNYSHLTISNSDNYTKGFSNININEAFLSRLMSRYSSTTSGYNGCNIGGLAEWQVRNAPGHVIVLRCNGTATISGNIITGHDSYTAIDQIPQVIIIANNININYNVTEVDAWLIATSSSSSANGTVNTCPQFQSGSTDSNDVCSWPLTINGPVITGRIYLNRTAGARPAERSIEPAEVFNLRADAYLWAYSQSEDYHQAITTYSREVAPRY